MQKCYYVCDASFLITALQVDSTCHCLEWVKQSPRGALTTGSEPCDLNSKLSKESQWQKGIISVKFSMRGKLPMVEVLCNPHFVQVGSRKRKEDVFEFLNVGHILILPENMLFILGFEPFNQITIENWWKSITVLQCHEKQMLGAPVPHSITHLHCINATSSQ